MVPTIFFTIIYELLLFFTVSTPKRYRNGSDGGHSPLSNREGDWAELTFAKSSGTVSEDSVKNWPIGSLSKGVFERCTSTGSEDFSLLICLYAIKFVLPSFFTLVETILLKILAKPLFRNVKSPLPVDLRRSKRLCLNSLIKLIRRSLDE